VFSSSLSAKHWSFCVLDFFQKRFMKSVDGLQLKIWPCFTQTGFKNMLQHLEWRKLKVILVNTLLVEFDFGDKVLSIVVNCVPSHRWRERVTTRWARTCRRATWKRKRWPGVRRAVYCSLKTRNQKSWSVEACYQTHYMIFPFFLGAEGKWLWL